jgi:fructose-bisphosphate aldolase class I
MSTQQELQDTVNAMVQEGKGILAADESTGTITKRLNAVGVESSENTRRAYRELLLTTEGISDFLSGVILFEETLGQVTSDNIAFPEVLKRQGIVPGIKVDKGLVALSNAGGDKITQGLDGLAERLAQYKEQGARFTKWRDVYPISPNNPTRLGIDTNAEVLARYAAVCQEQGFVPIVEPEVLIDGDHTIERCAEVTEAVLHAVFHALHRHRVQLEYMLLKPNMVVPGKSHSQKASPEQVAKLTVTVLRRTVPAAVPSINFLSGGQSPEEATSNLNAMNAAHPNEPWALSFSYARALQEPPMALWSGKSENVKSAQQAFHRRAQLNSAARRGEYRPDMETAA